MRMKLLGFMGITAALLLPAVVAHAGALPLAPQVGDTYEITLARDSAQQGSDGSSGSSHDKDAIIERVIGVRADGLELQYHLPDAATADERARNWQFPARVFKPFGGAAQLLNGPELEARADGWLKAAGWPRTVCGHWIFTWNAFRLECDPQSVIKTVQSFDLRSADLREGAPYQEIEARGSGKLTGKAAGPDGGSGGTAALLEPSVRSVRSTRLGRIREYRQRCDFVELWRFLDPFTGRFCNAKWTHIGRINFDAE